MEGQCSMTTDPRVELHNRIEIIESGYEFMLAYAAQGHESDKDAGQEQDIRKYLNDIDKALDDLGALSTKVAEESNADSVNNYRTFLEALDSDAKKAQGVVRLVLAQSAISSLLIDNLNASSHLRALLTDMFVIDEAFKRL